MQNSLLFKKPYLIALAFLGFNSGFAFILPNVLIMALCFYGTSTDLVGKLFLASLPYSFKILWSPITDHYIIPGLAKFFGQRRSWLLFAQIGLLITSFGFILQPNNIWILGTISTLFVFFAATQDLALDAYRIEILPATELATGTTFSATGFRIGILLGSTLPLYLLKNHGWSITFLITIMFLLIGPIATFLVKEPNDIKRSVSANLPSLAEHLTAVFKSLVQFLQRANWYWIVLFIFFYKIGDSIPNAMKGPLLVDLNFTPAETALISQAYGTVLMILGGVAAGILVNKLGIFRSILIGSTIQLLSPSIYAWLTVVGHNLWALALTTTVQSLACGIGSTILVIYVSSLCKKDGKTATEYALIYSFSSLTRTILSSGSGIVAMHTNWTMFFVGTLVCGLPIFIIIRKLFANK